MLMLRRVRVVIRATRSPTDLRHVVKDGGENSYSSEGDAGLQLGGAEMTMHGCILKAHTWSSPWLLQCALAGSLLVIVL